MTDIDTLIAELRAGLDQPTGHGHASVLKSNLRALLDHIERLEAVRATLREAEDDAKNYADIAKQQRERAEAAETKLDLLQGECDAKRNIIASLEAELARLRKPVSEGEVGEMVKRLTTDVCTVREQETCSEESVCVCKVQTAAADLIQRLAAPVTEGEVGEMVKRLRELSKAMLSADMDMRLPAGSIDPDEAADLIQRLAATEASDE